MSVRVEGLGRVLRALGRVPGAMREARRETLNEWAEDVKDTAEGMVPRRTGALAGSLESKVHEAAGVARVGVWDQNTLEYALYVEKGTSSMDDQPYLLPAFEAHRREVARKYRDAFRRHMGV